MSKTCVAIPTAIWSDPNFTRLNWQAQRLYLLMFTQRETTLAGTLPLRTRRWAQFSTDATPETVTESLAELEDAGWALVDRSSEEVALRMFTPPAGHKQLQAALSAASRIESLALRLAVMDWLANVGHGSRRSSSSSDARLPRMRLAVYERDEYCCLHCGWAPDVPNGYDGRHALGVVDCDPSSGQYRVRILELDHIHPESLGGKFVLDNLQTLCNSCNARKGARV